jgi:hypothetical protein
VLRDSSYLVTASDCIRFTPLVMAAEAKCGRNGGGGALLRHKEIMRTEPALNPHRTRTEPTAQNPRPHRSRLRCDTHDSCTRRRTTTLRHE